MALHLGSVAPDFTQESTEGPIHFHEWIGDPWAVLFSHPKDFTPVCTTELGMVAKLKGEFDKRNTKIIALSVDDVKSHKGWIGDIEETQHTKTNFPILGDADRKVSKLYGMIHPEANDTARRCARSSSSIRTRSCGYRSPIRPAPGATSRRSCA